MKLKLLLPLLILFIACDNELDVVADYKDIPVVYGILSLSDTAQYIRVEKAFIDENEPAGEIARIADSLYYDNAQVSIFHDGNEYILERVDGNLEGYEREEGAFAQAPNYLYKIHTSSIGLVPGDEYLLRIQREEEAEAVTATTNLVGPSEITFPGTNIGFAYIQPSKFRWRKGEAARVFDIYIEFNYSERMLGSSMGFEKKSVTWKMASGIPASNSNIEEFEKTGIDFYSFLAGNLTADPNIERRFDDVTVILDSGGIEIYDLIRIENANLGITSSQDVPAFTNLSEGRGIFSSMHRARLTGLELKGSTLDSLINGYITKDLNFRN